MAEWHLDARPCWTDEDFEAWNVHEGTREECTQCRKATDD